MRFARKRPLSATTNTITARTRTRRTNDTRHRSTGARSDGAAGALRADVPQAHAEPATPVSAFTTYRDSSSFIILSLGLHG
ncbi:hypothetical protein EVAR_21796_1 [Eumeta japonica]|uniref:Uncharacterized protein n=1 Tax=Eumeta variegata TaxID=151549 RepID=A0A4C1YIC7_EUMVA|nr:hypothetical protein EVAR_21796_1 [Eumeta japonica]